MGNVEFNLKEVSDVQIFEKMLNNFIKEETYTPFNIPYSLVDCFNNYSSHKNGIKIFTAIADISINFTLIYADVTKIGIVWNNNFSKGKLEGGTILDSQLKFDGKMKIHRYYTSFIFRYRAIWDKLMGLLILKSSENDYELFLKAKSKKKFFKNWAKTNSIDEIYIDLLMTLLSNFDDKFRTAEAHGMGKLRKHTLSMQIMSENIQIEIIDYWNKLLKEIAKIIV